MVDVWRNTKTFPRLEVTKCGRLRAFHKSWGRYVEKRPRKDKDGYLIVSVRNDKGASTSARVHRLIAEAYIPNPHNKSVINHKNGIKDDNRIENLEWATIQENTRHGYDCLGVISSQSKNIALFVNGDKFSTYDSITKMSNYLGINRNNLIHYEKILDGVLKFVETDEKHENHNKPFYLDESNKINFRGRFYKYGEKYYDKVQKLSEELQKETSTIYQWVKNKKIKTVTFKEFLENYKNINW